MNDLPVVIKDANDTSICSRHRFLIMIISSILISFVLVVISMYVYYSSGAYQLDLSRPDYVSARSQVITNDSDFANYSSTGQIDEDSITEFKTLFKKQASKTKAANAFGGSPLSLESLGLTTSITE